VVESAQQWCAASKQGEARGHDVAAEKQPVARRVRELRQGAGEVRLPNRRPLGGARLWVTDGWAIQAAAPGRAPHRRPVAVPSSSATQRWRNRWRSPRKSKTRRRRRTSVPAPRRKRSRRFRGCCASGFRGGQLRPGPIVTRAVSMKYRCPPVRCHRRYCRACRYRPGCFSCGNSP